MVRNCRILCLNVAFLSLLSGGECAPAVDIAAVPLVNASVPVRGRTLDSFTFPQLGAAGSALVSVSFATGSASGLLLLSSSTGSVLAEISSSTPVQGGARITELGYFDLSAETHSQNFVFTGAGVNGAQGTAFTGVFLKSAGSEILVPLSTSEQEFQPAGGKITSYGDPAVATAATPMSAEAPAAHAQTRVWSAFQAKAGSWSGVLVTTEEAELSVAVDSSTSIPAYPDEKFTCISGPRVGSDGGGVFFGSNCSIASSQRSGISNQAAQSLLYRTRRRSEHCLTRFAGASPGAGPLIRAFAGIYRWTPPLMQGQGRRGVTVVADAATLVPGGVNGTETFDAFSSPALGADGTVAFVAEGNAGSLGIYAMPSSGGPLREVVSLSTTVPGGGFGDKFGDFPEVPSVGADGLVVFYASAPSTGSGIYAEVANARAGKAKIQALLTEGNTIGGQSIAYIGFGQDAYDATKGSVATYLVLGNNNYGVWAVAANLGASPAPAFV